MSMISESELVRYLLGEASEEEQARLEQQFFSDDDLYQQMLAIEDELRYEYAQGGLTRSQRKHFEQRYMTTDAGREKVALAKSVLTKLPPVEPIRKQRWWSLPQFALGAVALLALAAGSALYVETMRLREQVSQLQAERAQKAQEEPALAFVLTPGLTRDIDSTRRLVVPGDAGTVRFQLDRAKTGYASYRAELQTVEGAQVWSQDISSPTVNVPGRVLTPGDYELILRGISATGVEVAGDFYFTVVRR